MAHPALLKGRDRAADGARANLMFQRSGRALVAGSLGAVGAILLISGGIGLV
jgi:hypothetical protein